MRKIAVLPASLLIPLNVIAFAKEETGPYTRDGATPELTKVTKEAGDRGSQPVTSEGKRVMTVFAVADSEIELGALAGCMHHWRQRDYF